MSWFKQGLEGHLPKVGQYFFNIGTAISQFFNALLAGDPDETISSRCGKAANCGVWLALVLELLINFIFRDDEHCEDAIEPDEGKCQIWDWCGEENKNRS